MFNKICFQGNLVRNPEFADTRSDTDILNFTVASSRKYKDKEDVTFADCTAYGITASNIGKFFSKGDPIGVEGRLSQNNWEDRDGNKRSKLYITVDSFHFVGQTGGRDGGDNRGDGKRGDGKRGGGKRGGGNRGGGNRGGSRGGSRDGSRDGGQGGSNTYDDNIPF